MLNAFNRFISENHLCTIEDKILVAVSAGIDSVVLLDLFHRAGYKLGIAHCNFKLRGQESDEDEAFVRALSEKYEVDFHLKSFDTNEYALKNKFSIQEAARELRYKWFDELSKSNAYQIIAIGQHADDHIETFFINLLRGSGVAGLKGTPVKRGNIIRPLLANTRNDIRNYAEDNKLNYREDSSNSSEKYLRNQMRYQLMPQLEIINKDYRTSIQKSLHYLIEDHQLLERFVRELKSDLFSEDKNLIKINIGQVLGMRGSRTILFYLLKAYGFNRDTTDSIFEAMFSGLTGKLFYSAEYQLLIDRNFFILRKITHEPEDEIFYINSHDRVVANPLSLKIEIIENVSRLHIIKDAGYAYFDLKKLSFPLIIRKWKKGDRFIPFGMKGSKLISDYLVDQKVDRFEKENIYLLVSDGKIAWVIGYRISDAFRIVDNTKQALVFKISN